VFLLGLYQTQDLVVAVLFLCFLSNLSLRSIR
jgi:hypothetical protein